MGLYQYDMGQYKNQVSWVRNAQGKEGGGGERKRDRGGGGREKERERGIELDSLVIGLGTSCVYFLCLL